MTFFPQGSPRLVLRSTFQIDNAISDARNLHHFFHVVHAHNVRPLQDARGNRCGRAPDAIFRGSGLAVPGQGRAKKAFARSSHEQRITELRQLRELLQYFVILREAFAEADSRIEDDL